MTASRRRFFALPTGFGRKGETPILIDTSVFAGDLDATYSADEVALRAGYNHDDIPPLGRAQAVRAMSKGAASVLSELHARGEVGALVCMGGSNSATVFSHLVPVLPIGIPKILMATVVAGDTRPFMGSSDVVLLYPVVDVDGSNLILNDMIERLADTAVAISADRDFGQRKRTRRAAGLSMFGVTTPCIQRVSRKLVEMDIEPFVFHANGTGGRSLETFAAQGILDCVVDATMAELGNELLGGVLDAGKDRFAGTARAGLPQVIAPGAIDMINFGPRNTVPERFQDCQMIMHNELVTLVRTSPEDCLRIGNLAAERLGGAVDRTVICIPLGGTSMLDKEGAAFWNPEAVAAFAQGLRSRASPGLRIIESEHNINDPEFADLLVEQLTAILR